MNIIAHAQGDLAAAQQHVAELEQQLHRLKTIRLNRTVRPVDPSLWPSWEAEAQALEQELGQTDRALRLAHGRVVELRGTVQTAVNRVQAARGALGDAERAVERLDEREAELRAELARLEALRPATVAQANERRQELVGLLGVDVDELEAALAELDKPADTNFILSWSSKSEPEASAYPPPFRSEYGGPSGRRHFDQNGREVSAWGEPLP
jgi:chromosome segregation ATPase